MLHEMGGGHTETMCNVLGFRYITVLALKQFTWHYVSAERIFVSI